jgi:hypothetical protein
MPESAGSRSNLVRFCLVLSLAVVASATTIKAASDARLRPERAEHSPLFLFTMNGETSLTGFGCDAVAAPSSRVFTADPDYRETPFTVGLELFPEEASAPPAHLSERAGIDGGSAADARTPLSTRLSTAILHDETFSFGGDGAMEDVFVPEASMSVADLAALCVP